MTSWMPSWKKNGWKKKDGKEIVNLEELMELDNETHGMMIKWVRYCFVLNNFRHLGTT